MIEVAGLLVADDQLRFMRQSAGDGYALLLAAAKLGWKRAHVRAEPNCFEDFFCPGFSLPMRNAIERDGNVLNSGQSG